MEKSHYHYFKRVLFTEQSIAQRTFNYVALVVCIAEGIIGWIYILK